MVESVFEDRRGRVREAIGEGVLLMFAAPEFIRNGDVEHDYRQDSDFYYLTGLDEPSAALVIVGGATPRFLLFLRERDKEREVWDGPRAGLDGATSLFGADEAFPIAELPKRLPQLLSGHRSLFYRFGVHTAHDLCAIDALKAARRVRRPAGAPAHLVDSGELLHRMRWRKAPEEIAHMRRAIEITGEAHLKAMRACQPGRYEYELEAELRHVFRKAGCRRAAYSPIVGSGPNTTILHHIKNDRQIGDGDLVLIDAGCEFEYTAADVTRTFPANGKFTRAQRQVYEVVLAAQRAAFDKIAPGASLEAVHQASLHTITRGLIDLGFIQAPFDEAIEKEHYKPFFMHRTGHYLGMDVHDVAPQSWSDEPMPMEASVVITVEPGIYIAADEARVPAEFRGVGVRIEDDVLVTEHGFENLSVAIPTGAVEIEALMNGAG
jgi:Xaa-Pro aminopeptidase